MADAVACAGLHRDDNEPRHRHPAAPRWPHLDVPELWHFRELLGTLVWRDVVVRYKQTFLGIAWAILAPAFTALV